MKTTIHNPQRQRICTCCRGVGVHTNPVNPGSKKICSDCLAEIERELAEMARDAMDTEDYQRYGRYPE